MSFSKSKVSWLWTTLIPLYIDFSKRWFKVSYNYLLRLIYLLYELFDCSLAAYYVLKYFVYQ